MKTRARKTFGMVSWLSIAGKFLRDRPDETLPLLGRNIVRGDTNPGAWAAFCDRCVEVGLTDGLPVPAGSSVTFGLLLGALWVQSEPGIDCRHDARCPAWAKDLSARFGLPCRWVESDSPGAYDHYLKVVGTNVGLQVPLSCRMPALVSLATLDDERQFYAVRYVAAQANTVRQLYGQIMKAMARKDATWYVE